MIVPKELAKKACLIVMGSEGRKEQMLKTDQDNALIIDDEMDTSRYEVYMNEFTEKLIDFGFPRCKGNIMVSNEYWRKNLTSYKEEIKRWLESPSKDDYMNFAIFIDAICVAGDSELLSKLKKLIFKDSDKRAIFMANFAKSALLFDSPIGIFMRLKSKGNKIDVKKGGIFPIVQGIRSIALEYGINETNTDSRIREIKKLNIMDESLCDALQEAFDTLLNLRLKERLGHFEHEEESNSFVNIEKLNLLELELLKDSFKIVNKFKSFLAHHFKTDMLQ